MSKYGLYTYDKYFGKQFFFFEFQILFGESSIL